VSGNIELVALQLPDVAPTHVEPLPGQLLLLRHPRQKPPLQVVPVQFESEVQV
jgi:hypothetical protein